MRATVPISSTIPVNMSADLMHRWLDDLALDHEVVAQASQVHLCESDGLRHHSYPVAAYGAGGGRTPHHNGCDERGHPIDESGVEKRPMELATSLDEEGGDATAAQAVQEQTPIDRTRELTTESTTIRSG